ncbi:MAG TPA: mechanosensitive ion channel family protein [Anaerolineales bacterium]|nr:mechanosensitive ion channel family protein [Anaerolineales bacterium]HNN12279.1 mechanosensitive ion channel family protein [Anaerolineales bacterium]HNO30684.1 mechanosensitive ion channel family protein [Anaerolineales bacterium]
MQLYLSRLAIGFMSAIPDILIALLILAGSYYAGVWLGRLLQRVLERKNAEAGATQLLSRIVKWTIITVGVIAALQRFFNVTAFLAGLGIIGFSVGFALQNILQNFASGIILLIQQPFKVGDDAGLAGYDGTVLKIGLRTTEMKTLNGLLVYLPNADVLSQPIINYTRANRRRVDLPVSVSYESDPEAVRTMILSEIRNVPGYMDTPAPQVLFHTFSASSIDLTVFFWVDTVLNPHTVAKDMALTRIQQIFRKNSVEVPYPVQVVRTQPKRPTRNKK